MRFVALVSGGKDSIYSIWECLRNGHELVACVHLGRPKRKQKQTKQKEDDEEEDEEEEDDQELEESYMYQTAASEVMRTLVEDCLGVPLLSHERVGTSINTSLVYDGVEEGGDTGDEVEDLFLALQKAKERFADIDAVSSGAILSTYQRVRIENVCSRLGLTSLSYLWRLAPQKELLQRMLDDGIEAVVVRSACPPGLVPRKHLNKTLRFLWDTGLLQRLHERYQFHVCGEGGEYESLVIDSPLYQKKLVLDQVQIEETDDGVGDLKILACHAEDKTDNDISIVWSPVEGCKARKMEASTSEVPLDDSNHSKSSPRRASTELIMLPRVQQSTGGLFHVSEIMASMAAVSDNGSEAELAVQEAVEIFSTLTMILQRKGSDAKDVMFVHLYLSEISHFATINDHYQRFFGTVLPPSRSCVAVGKGVLPGGRRVLLDCLVQPGSGEYMRDSTKKGPSGSSIYASAGHATKTSKLREVLHVQSISHWAPVCVGPYSQVNTLRSGLHFMAGQIGLVPATMTLHPTWDMQLDQCWKNVAAVLDALDGGSLNENLLSVMIYVSPSVLSGAHSLKSIETLSKSMIQTNAKLVAGHIDGVVIEEELYGGYEDEETWKEMLSCQGQANAIEMNNPCPILLVSIPEMPKGASVEVEVIAATKAAASNLRISNVQNSTRCTKSDPTVSSGWDTGHSFQPSTLDDNQDIRLHASARSLGHQGAAMVLVFASVMATGESKHVDPTKLCYEMLTALNKTLANGRTGLSSKDVLHLRLFHTSTKQTSNGAVEALEDGVNIRCAFQGAISKWGDKMPSLPASTVVPVHAISVFNTELSFGDSEVAKFALQAVVLDPVHLETNLWIHKDRNYNT